MRMLHSGFYSARSDDRRRSNIARPSIPSKTMGGLQPSTHFEGYAKDNTPALAQKVKPIPTSMVVAAKDSLNYRPRDISGYSGIMQYSTHVDTFAFAAPQDNSPSIVPHHAQGSAFFEAAGLNGRGNTSVFSQGVAAYVCRPCEPAGSDGIWATNYNLSFPPIQSSGGSHGSGGGTHGRRWNNRRDERPLIASGDGGERPPPRQPPNEATPQRLRDNPERLAKLKTEMCHHEDLQGTFKDCPFGAQCNYAHGVEELKFRYTTLRLMESAGQIVNANTYLARPCMTWVMTGACPFGRRCTAMHDPFVAGPLDCPVWLPIATAKTNARIIVDRLAAHRDSSVHQENHLINQNTWENCRPSQRGGGGGGERGVEGGSIDDLEQMWADTYALVCNNCFHISGDYYVPPQDLTELQKLSIVRLMQHVDHDPSKENHYRDYTFAPTHSLHSELCMILQTRYFFLPLVIFTNADQIRREDLVKEISFEKFQRLVAVKESKSKVISAYEVAFAPKGDHSANVSIWFDPTMLRSVEQSQIKRMRRNKQKAKTQIRNEHTHPNSNGALISRTSSADFPKGISGIEPFVTMTPADDRAESHEFILKILEHRIDSIVVENCSSVRDEQINKNKLNARMNQLQLEFFLVGRFHKTWMWPKREGMGHVTISTKAPPGNIMPYIPLKSNKTSACVPVWNSFVKNIGGMNGHSDELDDSERLSVFRTLGRGIPLTSEPGPLPHIHSSASNKPISTKHCETWKELLLGVPTDGKWATAVRINSKKREEKSESPVNITPNARNTPLSTVPFVRT